MFGAKRVLQLIILLLVIILILFMDFAYKTFSLRAESSQVDAIVVLAGGKGRIEEGVRLYRNHTGRWLLLVGVDPVVRKRDLYKADRSGRDADNVVLENTSQNTLENAIYAKDMILARKVSSIILITSRYHIRRAELLFKSMLPSEIKIIPYPVDGKNLKEGWWRHRGSLRLLAQEFYKYYIYKVLFLFVSSDIHGDPLRVE